VSGAVVWVTGLPASGKSTLARRVCDRLRASGVPAAVLDGDAVRAALVPPPGYAEAERAAFYATLGNLAVALAEEGLVVVVAATASRRGFRDRVRARLSSGAEAREGLSSGAEAREGLSSGAEAREGVPRFVEVLVDVPPEICAARDPKGLWARARAGAAPDLPGAGVASERPEATEVVARGGEDAAAVEAIAAALGITPGRT
jgi:adenylylsulfate kinase